MAFFFNDHVHTKSFTPREHQVELFYSALERNIVICLGKTSEHIFIATKLIQEFAIDNRKSLCDNGRRIVYILEDELSCAAKATHVEQVTDLKVLRCQDAECFDEQKYKLDAQVLILTAEVCSQLLTAKKILPNHVKALLIDKCHNLVRHNDLCNILNIFKDCDNTRIVGFAVPLYGLTKEPGRLSYEIENIESFLNCQIETGNDLLSILRYSPKPKEYMLAYKVEERKEVESFIWNCTNDTLNFLLDHCYDPTLIYGCEFSEEIKKRPNPVDKPCKIIKDFLYILETLGPWAADKAAYLLLMVVEKLKIKTPYDRHYLLLGILTTLFVKIRAYCDEIFKDASEDEKIYKYSTPKVQRLLEVIKIFTPPEKDRSINNDNNKKVNERTETKNIKEQTSFEKRFKNTNKKFDTEMRKPRIFRTRGPTDPDLLCGLIFVDNTITAKVLFCLLNDLSKQHDNFRFLLPLFMSETTTDEFISSKDMDLEYKKQEEVLKKFRIHECNLLISTSVLEEGIDIPKCNFVMRFDFPKNYQSYVQCKSRARAADALHVLLVSEEQSQECVQQLAHYHYVEKILLSKCLSKDADSQEEIQADAYESLMPEYKPLPMEDAPKVTFNSAVSLINRYCAKLPSDTFTRLTPEWMFLAEMKKNRLMYRCSLRLPINSPLKYKVTSYLLPSRALAKRAGALQMCAQLHHENELDDALLPVGKENFRAHPEDGEVPALPGDEAQGALEARPGTTKRRQYYYKKIADALVDCKPRAGQPCYLYHVRMLLSCPLPEEQNTRGRKIYPPEESAIGFGILTRKRIPKLCPFPIYTRSGEVCVELKLSSAMVMLDEEQAEKVVSFLNYTFTNVLRLQKYLMLFDPNVSENSYIVVPVKRSSSTGEDVSVDWDFVELIHASRGGPPTRLSDDARRDFSFDPAKYTDAVVMPWYRNQDQPQYFYVAEICHYLNPKSSFPGSDYSTFEEYYLRKYGIQIQNLEQPLLDVDHTSARLNFLTPRYVNRKGVALPTSSEETKRAKRENLEQKQILVAELCAVHPFPASLWRQAVCLPCILYRINALLLADQIRLKVAQAIGLGCEQLPEEFEWPSLDFGWSLADVLKKSRESDKNKTDAKSQPDSSRSKVPDEAKKSEEKLSSPKNADDKSILDLSNNDELEIGTWSNDMLNSLDDQALSDFSQPWSQNVRYSSPTFGSDYEDEDDEHSMGSDYYSSDDEDESTSQPSDGLQITYTSDNVAEAFDSKGQAYDKERRLGIDLQDKLLDEWRYEETETDPKYQQHRFTHEENVRRNEEAIRAAGLFLPADKPIGFGRRSCKAQDSPVEVDPETRGYVRQVGKNLKCSLSKPELYRNEQQPAVQSERAAGQEVGAFSFDYQPELEGHPGPSPSLILQALTMSNANDGINLERLETIGDSFLKYAITTYLYCTYNNIHEGKLSHLRSKQVSNLNLYRLGRRKCLGESMIATKFEPHDNWLPPCYRVPKELEQVLIESGLPSGVCSKAEQLSSIAGRYTEVDELVRETEQRLELVRSELQQLGSQSSEDEGLAESGATDRASRPFIPYNLITQHSIPDKSIADCVEALIGAYLIACGPRGALLFMSWLGIHVLPTEEVSVPGTSRPPERRLPGSTAYSERAQPDGSRCWTQLRYGALSEPPSPLFRNIEAAEERLDVMLDGYAELERSIGYKFANRSYLLQAFTHASYQRNELTDCYQRLEFLGDAVLDYLITRHLYEDPRQHSPGALTDLRSALVNNTIFASLAVRCGFHRYFRHLSPGLNAVIDRFVRIQEENGHAISEEYYLLADAEPDDGPSSGCGGGGAAEVEEAEDVEVPKALGDVFESLAGAIYLDSNMSLDAVWRVYHEIMRAEIEQFSAYVPKSPIRELLELEPETAKFGKPEKLADGKRVRVTVNVFGKGSFKGIGRNYRIAKCTAAKCALKKLKAKK